MTTGTPDQPRDVIARYSPTLAWIAHHHGSLLLGGMLFAYTSPLLGISAFLTLGVIILLVVGMFSAGGWHRANPCLRCAADIPDNGPAEAANKARLLRFHHRPDRLGTVVGGWLFRITDRPGLTAEQRDRMMRLYLAAFTVGLLALLVGAIALLRAVLPDTLFTLLIFTWGGYHVYSDRASRFHNRLQPWCPYCRDDDGDGETTDTPNPPGTGVKNA